MKNILALIILCFLSYSAVSQSERWKQKNALINFTITPQFEFVKMGSGFGPTASLAGSVAFNNTFYLGGYITKKFLRMYKESPLNPGEEIDVNYQTAGVEFIYAHRLGLYRTKGGHYVHPKLKLLFGGRIGGGTFWIDDINKEKMSTRDYFYFIQPQAGISYPINDYISLNTGLCFTTAISVDKLSRYYEMKDFMGPGAYLAFRFTLFR